MSLAHELVLGLHSLTRWLVVAAAALAEGVALHGWWSRRAFGALDRRAVRALVTLIDVQVSLGLTLYLLLSPVARFARADWAAAWANGTLRFFGLLHPALAAAAAVAAHAAWIGARRAGDDTARHRRVALGVAALLVLLACAIPWPGSATPRPLLRLP